MGSRVPFVGNPPRESPGYSGVFSLGARRFPPTAAPRLGGGRVPGGRRFGAGQEGWAVAVSSCFDRRPFVLTIFALPLCRVHMRSLRGVISQKINVRAPHAVVRDAVVVPRGSEARRAPGARPGVFQQGSAFPSVSLALADAVGPRSSRRRPLGVLPGSIAGSFALPRPLPPLRLLCASRYLQYFTCPCLLSHVGL